MSDETEAERLAAQRADAERQRLADASETERKRAAAEKQRQTDEKVKLGPTPANPSPSPLHSDPVAQATQQDQHPKTDALGHPLDPSLTRTPGQPGTKQADNAATRLRAFEDAHFGRKAMRNNDGMVERGFGSPYKNMTVEQAAEHAALEKLVEAEQAVDDANAAVSVAKAKHETAKADVAGAFKAAEVAAAESTRISDEEAKADAKAAAEKRVA